VMEKFKSLDVYRKLPSDYLQPTYSGATLSIISTVIMVMLFLSELRSYMEIKTSSEMFIDINRGGEKLIINIDITLHRLPCMILSLDIQDVMGSHSVNVHGTLHKDFLDQNGVMLSQAVHKTKHEHAPNEHHEGEEEQPDYEEVKKAIRDKEGCRLNGTFFVNKVPGNFHISSHAFGPTIQRLYSEGMMHWDVTHKINHISFGDDSALKEIKKQFGVGVLNPLDEVGKVDHDQKKTYEYYLKVVPTTYEDINKKTYHVHQFTSNTNEVVTNMVPATYFRFDLSPITVRYWQYKQNIFHFLIQICAIIGGIFTVTGIIDALVHKSVVALLKKAEMGKLT